MSRIIATAILLFSTLSVCIAQTTTKVYTTSKTSVPPKIDGVLNDEVWQYVQSATDFVQNLPKEGKDATQKTEVRILYDDRALYVGATLYESYPDSISHQLGVRDADIYADLFRLGIDPYLKNQDAYFFEVYASGVQRDSRYLDATYDAVWESAVKINSKGWTVEMKIPYSAIRFPSASEQKWGLQFGRIIARTNEFDQWALTPKDILDELKYWGALEGIKDIQAPLRLSFTPFTSVYYENAPMISSEETSYHDLYNYNFGADLKYGIDEKFTLDLTLLPDFNQVQSDNKVKNISYQEVMYNENRPFFKEGTELFNKDNLFYSRRIGKTPSLFYNLPYMLNPGEVIKENPSRTRLLNAIKLSGRNNNGLGIGVFNAITDNAFAIVEDSLGNTRKILTEPLTNYNVLVFDQQLKNNSSVYFINTNVIRDKDYDDANVSGFGFMLCNKKVTQAIDASFDLSQKYSKNDSIDNTYSNLLGYASFIGTRRITGKFQWGISNAMINNSFFPMDMGYYVTNNKMKSRVYVAYNVLNPSKWFMQTYNTLTYDYIMNPQSKKPGYAGFAFDNTTIFLNYWNVNIGAAYSPIKTYDYNEPRIPGRYCMYWDYYNVYVGVNSDSRKALAFGTMLSIGSFISKFVSENYVTTSAVRYRVNDKLTFRYELQTNNDPVNWGFANIDQNGNIIFGLRRNKTLVNTLTSSYLFKNDMNLSLNVRHYWSSLQYRQYYTLLENGDYEQNDSYHANNNFNYNLFNIDLIYSWQFAPGSSMSLVYKNAIETENSNLIFNYGHDFRNTLESPQTNSLSLKILYYLDYQYLKKFKKTKFN